MIPTRRLLIVLWLLAAAALAASIWPHFAGLWHYAIAAVVLIAIADITLLLRPIQLTLSRNLPGSLPVGVWRDAGLRLDNSSKQALKLEVYDHYPDGCIVHGMPQTLELAPDTHALLQYRLKPVRRGDQDFRKTQVRRYSPLGLWKRNHLLDNPSSIKVYPNFSAVTKYILLATDNNLSQMGIRKRRRRGEGQDFHQLREYREGDSLRQIDWKATSRMRKLISREYQDERDQEIVFLVDCGRRMLAQDDELSHFDHTLNAVLLMAYVALRQGDAVGLGTFSGEPRWLPPAKGVANVNRILNSVYDLYPSTQTPDYSEAVTQLLLRQRKRSLVVVITNLRDEDSSELLPALKTLKHRHLVLLASMQEQAIQDVLEKQVHDFDDALRLTATHDYLGYRQRTFEEIRANGILSLDVTPANLSVSLVNHYLQIKSSGAL